MKNGAGIGGMNHNLRGEGKNGIDIGGKYKLLTKHIGLIEQLIAASSRIFIGTSSSSFTSFIQRLRGHLGRRINKDLSCYYHDKYIAQPNPIDIPPPKCRHLEGKDADLWRM